MESLQVTDEQAGANAVAPRVTLDDIKANIKAVYYTNAWDAVGAEVPRVNDLDLLTICIIVCNNGFIVIGKSAPASRKNFNAELGAKFAKEDAMRQLWPLMGYALREKLQQKETQDNEIPF